MTGAYRRTNSCHASASPPSRKRTSKLARVAGDSCISTLHDETRNQVPPCHYRRRRLTADGRGAHFRKIIGPPGVPFGLKRLPVELPFGRGQALLPNQ